MKAYFKCANCSKETPISGEGPRHLGCQGCGCGDIFFSTDVILSPISDKDPGDVFDSISVKKEENFLANHSLGNSWRLSFPVSVPEVLNLPKSGLLKRVPSSGGFYNKL